MKWAFRWSPMFLLCVSLVAQTSPKTMKNKAPSAATEQQLRQTISDLQSQLQQVRQEFSSAMQQMQQQINQLQASASQAQISAQTASITAEQNTEAVAKLGTNLSELATAQGTTNSLLEKAEKRVGELEEPASIHFKGIKLTPGGYASFVGMYRTHNANADSRDQYGQIPLDGSANSKLSEWRTSGRASRLSLRADGTVFGMKTMGYFEADFLGSSPTGNEAQTNSFTPRLRLAFVNVSLPGGWSVAGGQNWTLLQTTRKGIEPLAEWIPKLINISLTPGFSYARLGSIRMVKSLGAKTWFGFSVENPATVTNVQCINGTSATTCNVQNLGNIQGLINSPNTTSPSNPAFASGQTPSTNIAPDLAAKFAFEPGWGHYEIKAVGRFFRDRIYPNFSATPSSIATTNTGTNRTTEGGGIGFGAILPVSKKIDIAIQALAGRGIGRYGSTSGPDVTVRTDGTLVPIKAFQGIVGIETHPNPKTDFVVYFGDEYYGRTSYASNTALFGAPTTTMNAPVVVGYGATAFLDRGCNLEFPATSTPTSQLCQTAAQNRNVWAIHPAFWYRFWKGKEGSLQYGASYTYVYRKPWAGLGGNPTGIENIFMNALRWYFP